MAAVPSFGVNTTGSLGAILPGWTKLFSGKIRDIYRPASSGPYAGSDVYLIVATDRIAAFDRVIPTKIPGKGKILTQLSLWWFEKTADIVPNHAIAADNSPGIEDRGMLVRGLQMEPYEIQVRGYVSDRVLGEYTRYGTIDLNPVPPGLRSGDPFATPIIGVHLKGPLGERDTPIPWDSFQERVGSKCAEQIERIALALYERGHDIAASRGLILADAKFEFGRNADAGSDKLVFADEAFTPDSAHYWLREDYERLRQNGEVLRSYDKEVVGKWLASPQSGWNVRSGTQPPPIPADVVADTFARYARVYQMLTGTPWSR
ncbi:phosphoribosylaminoimidazole-succinocarboxamide synthase [Actinobaculum suis]|uniref:Phosphoribosylaminoimidazole-succinocarboxamide synthase n=1 Tax=Actinobaculum suis TaxID=1657 RepID=A0A1B9BE11_9ACTO|nr:phosphoribosylaminoimidazolesuccinocarboxamide synthase [Actinobaculum suis]MDY5152632.1 phosphoribosylaminoimidazolesuccinocarboxamide synthase [Actinobaculum suis]OCA95127.1 hypothetical protein ACU20_04970 [Actinobaculum suis]OCA95593.1 hypothetical protein ACU21_03550 [Actinobaculum suis]SDE11704.1 phosphoribosylaminoimidazole-succinocarboxamide synthase [Actinobaculum suis]